MLVELTSFHKHLARVGVEIMLQSVESTAQLLRYIDALLFPDKRYTKGIHNQQFWNQVPKNNNEWVVSHRSGEKVSKQTRTVKTDSVIRHCEKEDRERRQGLRAVTDSA